MFLGYLKKKKYKSITLHIDCGPGEDSVGSANGWTDVIRCPNKTAASTCFPVSAGEGTISTS